MRLLYRLIVRLGTASDLLTFIFVVKGGLGERLFADIEVSLELSTVMLVYLRSSDRRVADDGIKLLAAPLWHFSRLFAVTLAMHAWLRLHCCYGCLENPSATILALV